MEHEAVIIRLTRRILSRPIVPMLAAILILVLLQPAAPEPSARAAAAVEAVRSAIADTQSRLETVGPAESLAGEIFRRVAVEQAARRALAEHVEPLPLDERRVAEWRAWRLITPLDADNTAWLKRHLPPDGWFRISRDGEGVTNAAFLIVQHSGDLALMKQVLARMEPLARRGEVRGEQFALLYDRTALGEGRLQRYGSQLICTEGRLDFHRLEDPKRVDERRKAIGMRETLAEYASHFAGFRQPC